MDAPVSNVMIDGKSSFLIRLTWNRNIGEMTVFDFANVKTWSGLITEEYCRDIAALLQMELTDYQKEIGRALRNDREYHAGLCDQILSLKKTESPSDLTYKIATITLKEEPVNEILPEFMAGLANQLNQMSADIVDKDERIRQLDRGRKNLHFFHW